MTLTWEGTDVFERLVTSNAAAPTSAADAPPPVDAADLITLGVLTVED